MKKKSRDLSLLDFLIILQKEYIVAELRRKIYRSKDNDYYSKLMKGKREKVKDIAKRNNLATIFNDDNTKISMYLKVYGSYGFPTFVYRDAEDKSQRQKKDFYRYYEEHKNVRINIDGSDFDKLGLVDKADFDTHHVMIDINNELLDFSCELVSRIF